MIRGAAFVILILAALSLACGGDSEPAAEGGVRGDVTVFAASSLTEAFTEIGERFEAANPGADVVINFGGSPTLRTQLEQGARADVFASADVEQMDLARTSGVVDSSPATFARNSLVIIAPTGNPGAIESPADLARNGLKLVFANENVPVGAYTLQMLAAMDEEPSFGPGFSRRVLDNVVSLESNVKQVVAKVELGEADAGVVYSTDATAGAQLERVAVPDEFNVMATYPIALVAERRNDAGARAFIDFVLSEEGQGILEAHGFLRGV